MKKLIMCDIDGTLMHDKEIMPETIKAIQKLREQDNIFVLSTGRRRKGYDQVASYIPHDFGAYEHGCLITGGDPSIGNDYYNLLAKGIVGVCNSKYHILSSGFDIDMDGRLATLRVKHKERDNLTAEEMSDLEQKFKDNDLPVKTTINQGMFDVIPQNGGKDTAMEYLANKLGILEMVAIGDDINDLGMLSAATKSYCPRNACDKVKGLCSYVSPYSGHRGIQDVLKKLE